MSENNPNEIGMGPVQETLVDMNKKKTSIFLLENVEIDYQDTIYKKGYTDD